jgi:hypothetical protein
VTDNRIHQEPRPLLELRHQELLVSGGETKSLPQRVSEVHHQNFFFHPFLEKFEKINFNANLLHLQLRFLRLSVASKFVQLTFSLCHQLTRRLEQLY